MFRLKTKNKETVSECRNIEVRLDDTVLFAGDLMDLPLKDEWIIKKSIEFFNDPEPCFIHRGAVTIRLLNEIWGEHYIERDADVLWRTVNRLRIKLSKNHPIGDIIKIERGVGYVLEP